MRSPAGLFVCFAVALLASLASFSPSPVLADDDHNCTPLSWLNCVGTAKHCRCYDRPNDASEDTVEKEIVRQYAFDVLLAKHYQNFSLYSTPDVVLTVPQLGITISGQAVVIGYFAVSDITVSDTVAFLSIELTALYQDDLVVTALATILNYGAPLNQNFTTQNVWIVHFNDRRQIVLIENFVDTLQTFANLQSATSTDPTIFCPLIQARCTGANQYYADTAACIDFMNTIREGSFSQLGSGNSRYCRSFHTNLAKIQPDVHCIHTSPLNISPFVTPCNDY